MKRNLVIAMFLMGAFAPVAATQTSMTPPRVRVGQNVMSTQVATKVAPIYPPQAKEQHIQGTVTLRVEISKTGAVEYVKLISGHPMLAPAAIEAVKQWKYKPFLLNGEAIAAETDVTVNFTLADETATGAPAGIEAGKGGVNSGVIPVDPGNAGGPAVPRRARVSQSVMQGMVVRKVQPEYPADARAEHIQGEVQLKATIDKEGNVANLQLISGHPVLAPAAIEAVRQWKYRPYLLNGEAVEIETTVTVNFALAE